MIGCVSVDLDYYVSSSLELPALTVEVNRVLGCALAPYEGDHGDYFAWFMGMEFSLNSDRDMTDDGELDYSSFRYSCGFRTSGIRMLPIQLPVMLSVVRVLQVDADLGGMLVFDAQMLLARYVRKDDFELAAGAVPFVDALSGTDLDHFDRHVAAIAGRFQGHDPFAP